MASKRYNKNTYLYMFFTFIGIFFYNIYYYWRIAKQNPVDIVKTIN